MLVGDGLDFVANPTEPDPGESVTFESTGAGPLNWAFGDGATSTGAGERVTHSYGDAGSYTVTVENATGPTATQTVEVTGDPPETLSRRS